MTLPNLDEWRTQALRATFFTDVVSAWSEGLFERVVGGAPEQVTQHRQTGLTTFVSSLELGRIEMRLTQNRIDLMISPEMQGSNMPALGSLELVESEFRNLAHRLIHAFDGSRIIRVAYGVVLALPSADMRAANSAFLKHAGLLGSGLENSRDLVLQVNRPVNSKVSVDVAINRIIKRASVIFQLLELNASGRDMVTHVDNYVYQLETDFNTAVENKLQLDSDRLSAMIDELAQLSLQSIRDGG